MNNFTRQAINELYKCFIDPKVDNNTALDVFFILVGNGESDEFEGLTHLIKVDEIN